MEWNEPEDETMRHAIPSALVCAVFLLSLGVGTAGAGNVFLLEDGGAGGQVRAALEAEGHLVYPGGFYSDWDGISPNLALFDAVVFLYGVGYGSGLQPAAETAIIDFVGNGGGLFVTEWLAYEMEGDGLPFSEEFFNLMPVIYNDAYLASPTWNVVVPNHPLTLGLPAQWSDVNGYSDVVAHPMAHVLIETESGIPLLSYRLDVGGTVVHMNHDMTDTNSTISPNSMQVLVNCVSVMCLIVPMEESSWSSLKSLY